MTVVITRMISISPPDGRQQPQARHLHRQADDIFMGWQWPDLEFLMKRQRMTTGSDNVVYSYCFSAINFALSVKNT